jgi:hypothetical protein
MSIPHPAYDACCCLWKRRRSRVLLAIAQSSTDGLLREFDEEPLDIPPPATKDGARTHVTSSCIDMAAKHSQLPTTDAMDSLSTATAPPTPAPSCWDVGAEYKCSHATIEGVQYHLLPQANLELLQCIGDGPTGYVNLARWVADLQSAKLQSRALTWNSYKCCFWFVCSRMIIRGTLWRVYGTVTRAKQDSSTQTEPQPGVC